MIQVLELTSVTRNTAPGQVTMVFCKDPKIQNFHNANLEIEGLLLTMYDSRLRLSNNVIEEVNMHFADIVFTTIIQRNVRLSEATGFGKSIIKYDANCRGAINYLNLAKEFIEKNELISNERNQ